MHNSNFILIFAIEIKTIRIMVTNFYEAYYKMFSVKNEVICFLTYWVVKNGKDNVYEYHGKKKINIPINEDYNNDVHCWEFYGLKVNDGTLFVGVYTNNNNIVWFEIEDDSLVLTMQTLWNIIEVLFLSED